MKVYLLILSVFLAVYVSGSPQLESRYACEGRKLDIECNDGSVIRLIRANYGRFGITYCNKMGITNWNTNCMSTKSLRVVHNRCHMQQSCSLVASVDIFDDPCPDTGKYLEVHYQCVQAPTTTTTVSSAPPAWFMTVPTI